MGTRPHPELHVARRMRQIEPHQAPAAQPHATRSHSFHRSATHPDTCHEAITRGLTTRAPRGSRPACRTPDGPRTRTRKRVNASATLARRHMLDEHTRPLSLPPSLSLPQREHISSRPPVRCCSGPRRGRRVPALPPRGPPPAGSPTARLPCATSPPPPAAATAITRARKR
jgi:hypothetical protein